MPDLNKGSLVFEAWLFEQPADQRETLVAIRELILDAGYEFTEGIKWGTPNYWLPKVSRRTICYLACETGYVRLGFFNGASIPDPHGMIEGTGKKLRHIKVRDVSDSNRQELISYVRSATEKAIEQPESLAM